jgi:hypothetical protein
MFIMEAGDRARAILACANIPPDPILILDIPHRRQLQFHCLVCVFLKTLLRPDLNLLRFAVNYSLNSGLAEPLIEDHYFGVGLLAAHVADYVWCAAATPGTPFHPAWCGNQRHASGRRRSEPDLSRPNNDCCTCRMTVEDLTALREHALEFRKELLLMVEDHIDTRGTRPGQEALDYDYEFIDYV